MSRLAFPVLALLLLAALPGCGKKDETAAMPPPREPTDNSIAQFCSMSVTEHSGPKGQIFIKSRKDPFWFASVRDAFAFTMLPEEPKDIVAIYVNDMTNAADWDHPGRWIDAHKAVFVIGSKMRGGMGEAEAVPFAQEPAARSFVAEHGGRLVRFDDMPRDYILPGGVAAPGAPMKMNDAPGGTMKMDTAPADGAGDMHDKN